MRRADIEVPNRVVDVDSWTLSACYPRGNFYPLISGQVTLKPVVHYGLLSQLLGMSASQSSWLLPLHVQRDVHPR